MRTLLWRTRVGSIQYSNAGLLVCEAHFVPFRVLHAADRVAEDQFRLRLGDQYSSDPDDDFGRAVIDTTGTPS